jgi:single-strand DNA-binding protein
MASINRLSLLGHIGMDPEIVYMPSGDPLAKFSLATTETWKDKQGDRQEKTTWHRVEVWGKTAEIVRDYCAKGKQVYLEGQMTYEEYTGKDGEKKTSAKVKLSGPRSVLVLLGGGERGTTKRSEQPKSEPSNDFQVEDSDVPF